MINNIVYPDLSALMETFISFFNAQDHQTMNITKFQNLLKIRDKYLINSTIPLNDKRRLLIILEDVEHDENQGLIKTGNFEYVLADFAVLQSEHEFYEALEEWEEVIYDDE
jgi:hypothetical protein